VNNTPPTDDAADDLEALYRRSSAQDPSRPNAKTRQVILEHSSRLATNRSKVSGLVGFSGPKWRRPVLFGSLAAAVVAGLMVGPQYLRPKAPTGDVPVDRRLSLSDQGQSKSVGLPESAVALSSNSAPEAENLPVEAPRPSFDVAPRQGAPSPAPTVAANTNRARSRASKPAAASEAPAAQAAAGDELVVVTGARIRREPSPVDARDADGRTALMLAVIQGRLDAVVMLLGRGADPNAADAAGVTPLQAARAENESAIADALVHAGAH
jgi:hypothetical protein